MDKGYEEKIYFKNKFEQKLNMLKHKKISLTFFISLASLYIAMVITFTVVYSSYKQTHPYTAQEISELTSIVYVLPYLDTDNGVSYYVEVDTTDNTQEIQVSTTEEITNQELIIEETQIETTIEETTTQSDYTSTQEIQTTETTTEAATTQTTTTITTTMTTTTQTTTHSSASLLSSSLDINALVYVTASGTKFHFSTCSYLSGSKVEMTYGEVLDLGYSPCSRCFPDG